MSWDGTIGHGIAVSIDYGLEMLFYWRDKAPMTLSSRAGLALRAGKRWAPSALLGRLLNWIDPGHTDAAIAADIARANNAIKQLTE